MDQFLTHFSLVLLGAWLFWALYVFTMGIYRAKLKGTLKGLNLILAYPVVIFAVLVDVFFNIVVATVVFVDLPREMLVTTRLQRYMNEKEGWRKNTAEYICNSVLDIFDPDGDHC